MQGNIVEWKKKEGDELASGDILCMVETDKVQSHGSNSMLHCASSAHVIPATPDSWHDLL